MIRSHMHAALICSSLCGFRVNCQRFDRQTCVSSAPLGIGIADGVISYVALAAVSRLQVANRMRVRPQADQAPLHPTCKYLNSMLIDVVLSTPATCRHL